MQLKNSDNHYGWVSITMHWLMAVVIIALFALGVWMVELNYYDSWYNRAPWIHKSAGMLLLFMLLFRFAWRVFNILPALMGSAWERVAALAVHRLHYLLMFVIAITGYLIPTAEGVGIDVFGWFTVPASFSFTKESADLIGLIHLYASWAVIVLAGLHAVAALKHHFIDQDMTLLRILGITQRRKTE